MEVEIPQQTTSCISSVSVNSYFNLLVKSSRLVSIHKFDFTNIIFLVFFVFFIFFVFFVFLCFLCFSPEMFFYKMLDPNKIEQFVLVFYSGHELGRWTSDCEQSVESLWGCPFTLRSSVSLGGSGRRHQWNIRWVVVSNHNTILHIEICVCNYWEILTHFLFFQSVFLQDVGPK